MQDTYEVSEAVQSYVTARKHTCLRVSVQGARMPLGGGPGERKCKRAKIKTCLLCLEDPISSSIAIVE